MFFSAVTWDLFSANFYDFPKSFRKNIIWDSSAMLLVGIWLPNICLEFNLLNNIFVMCVFLVDFEEVLQIYQLLLLLYKK